MPTTFIYALCEPDTRKVRYIGKANNPKDRLKEHVSESVKLNSHLGHWLARLRGSGVKPILAVLREVPEAIWQEEEIGYIRQARELGMNLVNVADGGEGRFGFSPSLETRQKNRLAQTGKKRTPEACDNIRRAKLGDKNPNFGRSCPEATKAGTAKSNRERVRTPQELEKLSESKRGPKNPNFGKTRSEATRAKQSETCRAVFALRRMPDFIDGEGI